MQRWVLVTIGLLAAGVAVNSFGQMTPEEAAAALKAKDTATTRSEPTIDQLKTENLSLRRGNADLKAKLAKVEAELVALKKSLEPIAEAPKPKPTYASVKQMMAAVPGGVSFSNDGTTTPLSRQRDAESATKALAGAAVKLTGTVTNAGGGGEKLFVELLCDKTRVFFEYTDGNRDMEQMERRRLQEEANESLRQIERNTR